MQREAGKGITEEGILVALHLSDGMTGIMTLEVRHIPPLPQSPQITEN